MRPRSLVVRFLSFLVTVAFAVLVIWFTWDLVVYMHNTPPCAREGTCVTDR